MKRLALVTYYNFGHSVVSLMDVPGNWFNVSCVDGHIRPGDRDCERLRRKLQKTEVFGGVFTVDAIPHLKVIE